MKTHPDCIKYKHWRNLVAGIVGLRYPNAKALAQELGINTITLLEMVNPPTKENGKAIERLFKSTK